MKKNQGFTLIELLAVIVVLAIIALIATPLILNVIEKSKKGAAESSVLGYIDSVEKTNFENMLDGKELELGSYDIADIQAKYKGEGPTNGFIIINAEKVIHATLCMNNYYIKYDGQTTKIEKNKTCDEVISIKQPTKEQCFAFSSGSITDYYDNEGNDSTKPSCPRYVVIPETIKGTTVTNIERWAFSYNKLIGITMPDSITAIGEGSFQGNQLTRIKIPNSVTSIGVYAFNNNQLLDDQAFVYYRNSDGSEDKTKIVSYGGANRDNVVIPNGVKYIGYVAFMNNRIKNITIPNSVTTIVGAAFIQNQLPDDQAFIYKRNSDGSEDKTTIVSYGGANENVIIPDGVTTIGDKAFYNNNLKSLILPDGLIHLGKYAFEQNKLTNIIIPNSVKIMKNFVFSSNQLTSVKIIGKVNSSAFTTYDSTYMWGWAPGYNNTNIEWNATK